MPLYGDLATVKTFLRASPDVTLDADADARLVAVQTWVSAALDERLGRTFGTGPASDTTVLIWAANSDILLLPRPARLITTVTVGGAIEGGTISGGTVLDATAWAHWFVDEDGLIHALRLLVGIWGQDVPVQIVGQFAGTDADVDVPDDLTELANYLITEEYKIRQASPAGFIGPAGETVPIRNPWNAPMVQTTLAKYRVSRAHLVV